jgi:hypothetical protein
MLNKKDWTTSSNINKQYSTLNNEYSGGQLCIQLKINKHALPITITKVRGGPISIRFLQMFHPRFGNAT